MEMDGNRRDGEETCTPGFLRDWPLQHCKMKMKIPSPFVGGCSTATWIIFRTKRCNWAESYYNETFYWTASCLIQNLPDFRIEGESYYGSTCNALSSSANYIKKCSQAPGLEIPGLEMAIFNLNSLECQYLQQNSGSNTQHVHQYLGASQSQEPETYTATSEAKSEPRARAIPQGSNAQHKGAVSNVQGHLLNSQVLQEFQSRVLGLFDRGGVLTDMSSAL